MKVKIQTRKQASSTAKTLNKKTRQSPALNIRKEDQAKAQRLEFLLNLYSYSAQIVTPFFPFGLIKATKT